MLSDINNVSQRKEMRLQNRNKGTVNVQTGPLRCQLQKHVATDRGRSRRSRVSHLRLSFLQKRLQLFLRRPAFMIIANDQDDVVPAKLSHHVEPDLGLMRVWRHCAQERQVDALKVG